MVLKALRGIYHPDYVLFPHMIRVSIVHLQVNNLQWLPSIPFTRKLLIQSDMIVKISIAITCIWQYGH